MVEKKVHCRYERIQKGVEAGTFWNVQSDNGQKELGHVRKDGGREQKRSCQQNELQLGQETGHESQSQSQMTGLYRDQRNCS